MLMIPGCLNVNFLQSCDVSLRDKVAFACTYLDDTQLHNYVRKLTASVVAKGSILGLFLTGLSDTGIKLLTNFVNEVCIRIYMVELYV